MALFIQSLPNVKLDLDIVQTNILIDKNLCTKLHDDWAKNVISRVFTSFFYYINIRKLPPPPLGSHETNVLTRFHENWAKNVTSRRKMPRPLAAMFFLQIWTIFEHIRNINKINVLTNFHDDWAKIVTSRVFTSHVIQLTGTIFELNSYIKETNALTKFHENWAKNVTSRVFTCFHNIHIEKNAPPTGGHVFSPIWTIFELVRDINKTNVLTNFHDNWAKIVTFRVFTRKTAPPPGSHETNVLTKFHENLAKNVTSIVFTCFHYIHIEKNALPTGGHVFSPIWTIFQLVRDINKINVFTNFHDDWAKIVTSRVFKCFHYIHMEKNAPPTGGHVFSPIWTILELVRDINKTNVLTNFHDNCAKIMTSRVFTRKTSHPPPGSHVFQLTRTIFELNSHIKETNVLTKFHENWAENVTSRVFTCFHNIHIEKNAPPTGGHGFSPIWTIFEFVRDINKTTVLTNFHDNWAKIVISRVFTRKTAAPPPPPPGSHVIQLTGTIFEFNSHIKETNVLTKFHENWTKM
ncbi:hypothetical protein DPMN_067666 [Dreissena polymorpha]|uniref:Uncharacterized protein n=1 Tax=Dreissena polymorpha TaxID=45954 RepID=A0A9D3Z0Q3_DREPO|nr:hypothetical protein DPMN_067666 [Dreissena polymorpha]